MENLPNQEFYIGWQSNASVEQRRFLRKFILLLMVCISLIAIAFVVFEKDFSSARFAYGIPTRITGILTTSQVPMINVELGSDLKQNPINQQILLVGPGKHGADAIIHQMELATGTSLELKRVSLTGYLIYHDGHALMEVNEINPEETNSTDLNKPLMLSGEAYGTISGEISDPKCFFGVMKPGEGKPHLSCAARCIAGGIPPVLKSIDSKDRAHYYIIVDHDGKPVNAAIIPFVGDRVFLRGKIKSCGDWQFIFLDQKEAIVRVPDEMVLDKITCAG